MSLARHILHGRILIAFAGLWIAMLAPDISLGDVVSDWNEVAVAQDDREPATVATTWTLAEDAAEMVAVAMFQAVNTIEGRYKPYRAPLEPPKAPASAKAAAVAAAHAVLVQAYPGKRERLDEVYAVSLASISEGPELNSGIDLGERAAAQVIAWRQGDHANPGQPYRPETQPGMFVIPTLPTIEPWFISAKPWMLQSERQFLPGRPVDLKSATWAHDYNETKSLGAKNSTTRTSQQTLMARFWYAHQWESTLRQLASQTGRSLDQNARLYALVRMTQSDALQVHAAAKMLYLFWRPITAIRNGDKDGNESTERQADWEPLIRTPLHPEYPCGHCVDSMATAMVLQADGPVPTEGIAIRSEAVPNAVVYVSSYEALAEQISTSRIHAGAHFRSSVEAGKKLGRDVAEYALSTFLTPVL
jgi:hypothetical protein